MVYPSDQRHVHYPPSPSERQCLQCFKAHRCHFQVVRPPGLHHLELNSETPLEVFILSFIPCTLAMPRPSQCGLALPQACRTRSAQLSLPFLGL